MGKIMKFWTANILNWVFWFYKKCTRENTSEPISAPQW